MIRAVLWDNDGVLVDTERLFFETTRAAFAEAGVSLKPDYWAAAYLGQGMRSSELAAELGLSAAVWVPLLERRNAAYRKRLEGPIPLREGVRETLEALHSKVRLGLVTGSPRDQLMMMHRATGLLSYFELIVAGEDSPHSKPHPACYLKALEDMGVSADECLAVEDSPRGLKAAVAAGVRCVLAPHELTDLSACEGALRVKGVREVIDLVLKTGSPYCAQPL